MTILAQLEQQAHNAYTRGDMETTFQLCRQMLIEKADHPKALELLANEAMAQEQFEAAERHLEILSGLYPENAILILKLGYVRERQGKLDAALAAYMDCYNRYPENSVTYLYLGNLHVLKGDRDKAAEIFSLGEDLDENIMTVHQNPGAGDIMRDRSRTARQTTNQILTDLHLDTIRDMDEGGDLNRIRDAVWPQIDVRKFDYKVPTQKPHLFYIPDLPAIPFFNRPDLDWVENVEAGFDAIRKEVVAGLDIDSDGRPYLAPDMALSGESWDKIVGKMTWASVHLYKQGVADEDVIAKFPETLKALKNVPLARIDGNPSEIFISVLKPNTIIPPHFGVANNVLTVHLPLVVPEGCFLRVGDQTFPQKEGEIIAFDDSYDHEAQNPGQETRIVLIFEVWHPDLTEKERTAISATFAARTKWLENRSV